MKNSFAHNITNGEAILIWDDDPHCDVSNILFNIRKPTQVWKARFKYIR